MSLIGFRREDSNIEYLEEVQYSEDHLEDDIHQVIRREPRLVMGALTTRENTVLGSKLQLPTGKEPDLVVCDSQGTITVIEFKRDRSPRSAVTQLFDYASSLARLGQEEFISMAEADSLAAVYDAFDREGESAFDVDDFQRTFTESLASPQLLLVAYTISDDVRRMARWLRETHNLKINCVEFDYYERDDAEMFVPTVIGSDETQEIKEREESPKQKKYRRLFSDLLAHFKQERPGVTSRSAGSDSWLTLPIGHTNTEILWHLTGDPGAKAFKIAIRFQFDDSARNEEFLDAVRSAAEERPLDIPEEIYAGHYGSSGYTEMYIERDVGQLDDALGDNDLKTWVVECTIEFYEHLAPVLDEELS